MPVKKTPHVIAWLLQNFASEQLDGYICSKTRQEVEASRNLSLEDLPPILVLHLKRYSEKNVAFVMWLECKNRYRCDIGII